MFNCKICGYVFEKGITPICCPFCGRPTEISDEDIIKQVSNDESFINAMLSLKEKDPIEYQLKLNQFKIQLEQSQQVMQQTKEAESSKPKCPHCGSTAITAGQRGYSLVWGLFGSGNTVNRCSNCGHKWKPGK